MLRIEGLAELAAAVFLYGRYGESWLLFVVLLLAPDVSALGYVFGPRVGAYAYDVVHLELWPIAMGTFGVADGHPLLYAIALIWLAHIGMDRALGFGFKYPSAFKDTHLGTIGR
jgi:hypothetical protein